MKKLVKNCTILYNPVSTGFKEKNLSLITSVIKQNGINVEILESLKKGHMIDLVKEADRENNLILTLGGDGTVSEVYKALNEVEQKGLYAHVPTGTTNDMAKNYDVRYNDADKIVEDILNGEVVMMDSFKVNEEISAYTSVAGYLAEVPFKTKPFLKKYFSHGGYILTALPRLLVPPKKFNLSYETDNFKGICQGFLMAVSNSKGFAGKTLFPNANLSDGKLEMLIVTGANPNLIYNITKDYFKDSIDITNYGKNIITDVSSKITFKFNDGKYPKYPFDNDGEQSLVLPNKENPEVTFEIAKPIKVLKRKGN